MDRSLPRAVAGLAVAVLVVLASGTPAHADVEAAERQYRVARRLVVENSPEAAAALERVVALAPRGPLADDARVDGVRLLGIPLELDDLGRLAPPVVREARERLDAILAAHPDADRAPEARYLRGLLFLEPVPGFDRSAARLDLLRVANDPAAGDWRAAARLAIARLASLAGDWRRASDAALRLWMDESNAGARDAARLVWATNRMRAGGHGPAAATLQELADGGGDHAEAARIARDMAMRALFGTVPDTADYRRIVLEGRYRSEDGVALLSAGDGDRLIVADRRADAVLAYDPDGRVRARWTLEDVDALTVSRVGRIFAAAGERLVRLDDDGGTGRVVAVGLAGDWAPVTALAADGLGGLYLLGRRAGTVGYLAPGAPTPVPFTSLDGVRSPRIAWDGGALLLLDGRTRTLERREEGRPPTPLGTVTQERPDDLAVDGAGRILVLDGRNRQIGFYTAEGRSWNVLDLGPTGLQRPGRLMVGEDGTLHLLDDANGVWGSLP